MSDEALRELARLAKTGDLDARARLIAEVGRDMRQVIIFRPAFCTETILRTRRVDRRDVECRIAAKGPLGAATLEISTHWGTSRIRRHQTDSAMGRPSAASVFPFPPSGSDISVCVPASGDGTCPSLGVNCERVWTSALQAEPLFDILTDEGTDALHAALVEKYVDVLYLGEPDTKGKLGELQKQLNEGQAQ